MALDRRLLDLYDAYAHVPLPRRVFLERLIALAGSAAAAEAALRLLEPQSAAAAILPADDPRLVTDRVEIEGANGLAVGYRARPREAKAKLPGLMVIHENRGLNAHIEDVARRFAMAGFIVIAPDLLTPLGGTPPNPDAARDMIGKLSKDQVVEQARAVFKALKRDPDGTAFAGAVGFCWGGGMVNTLATRVDELDAGVVFYGPAPDLKDVPAIRAPLLLQHAGRDARVNAGLPAYEAALKAAGKPYELIVYPDVDHAFHNDTSAERYDAPTAKLAFDKAVSFLKAEAAKPR